MEQPRTGPLGRVWLCLGAVAIGTAIADLCRRRVAIALVHRLASFPKRHMPLEGWLGFGFDPLRIGSCVVLGTILALPVIIWQGWGYLRPGAGPNEVAWRRRMVRVAVAVELAAVVVGFYLVLPWLDYVSSLSADPEYQAHQAVRAAPPLLLLTVLVFELPVFAFGLAVTRSPMLASEG